MQTTDDREGPLTGTRDTRGARRGRSLVTLAALACFAAFGARSAPADADHVLVPVPSQVATGAVPHTARSFVIDSSTGITIMAAPSFSAEIAGKTLPRASLPALELRNGPGCRHAWVRVEESAWICGDHGDLSVLAPDTHDTSRPPSGEMLPWTYVFTRSDRTPAYRTLEAAVSGLENASVMERWEANWGMAVIESVSVEGQRILRGQNGFYLRRTDVYRAEPTRFSGDSFWTLAGDSPGVPFGWVAEAPTFVYATPDEDTASTGRVVRLSRVHIHALRDGPRGLRYARIGPDQWVRADHLRWVEPAPAPESVNIAAGERWIDVDLTSQTLIAYQGPEPVYATLVSTGDRYPTQPGEFRIWGKFLAHTMDNTESVHLPNHFRLGDVPYVQFFDHDRGLHAVYWHDGFGVARSHGCVNLSPRDADYLFHFTAQPLPPGWLSRSIPTGRGTLVRVRGRYTGTIDP